jgi:DnaJ-class molecular chaperone
MPSMHSLLSKLNKDFPEITFAWSERFAWSPDEQTVSYNELDDEGIELLLHELSHGLLGHHDYQRDIELLAMETAAWEKAAELAKNYEQKIDSDISEKHLDTYRDWMHARSTCPTCEATGYQTKKDTYSCVACGGSWRVNEARLCGLKRYSTKL